MKTFKTDKFILFLLGLEHLGFGLLGLISPLTVSELVGFNLNELSSFSEVRAHYSLFLLMGILSFLAIGKFQLVRFTYIFYVLIFGSYLAGRAVSIFVDGIPDFMVWNIIAAELLVVLISVWRFKLLKNSK